MAQYGSEQLLLLVMHVMGLTGHAQEWDTVRTPAPGPARLMGSFVAGCMQGAVALPTEGDGFVTLRRSRHRFFGHPTLIHYVQELGRLSATLGLGVLHIGDMAQPRGGPMPYGHRSHQIGLDVDIWFWGAPPTTPVSPAERETFEPPSLLNASGRALDARRWTPQRARLLQVAAEFPEVMRVIVNPVIKQALCETNPGASWLRKIRPWWGHDAHFHVRLRCPADQPDCLDQEAPPPGDGCDETLAWWFSEEARQPSRPSGARAAVSLPMACDAILRK
jgi:penicillin-insensitive murein endopeptidase